MKLHLRNQNIKKPALLPGRMLVLTVLIVLTSGCAEIKLGGKRAQEAFNDSLTAQMVHEAVRGHNAKVAKLIEQGADVNAIGTKETTPLMWVLAAGHLDVAELLLKKGADPNYRLSSGESIMALAAGGDTVNGLKLLLDYDGDPNARGDRDQPATMYAVRHYQFDNLKLLVDRGADVNGHTPNGLHSAARQAAILAQYSMVKYLLERGYNHDLSTLAGTVEVLVVSAQSPECALRGEVLDMLYARGIRFPVNNAPPLNDPCMRMLRDEGNVQAAVIVQAAEKVDRNKPYVLTPELERIFKSK
jgi:hypothetical protein